MAETRYNLSILDTTGHILFSRSVKCADDLAALEEATRDCAGHPVEVWQEARLVARVKADDAPLDEKDGSCL